MDYMPALYALQSALNAEGRPAVLNRQLINPPCVLITLAQLDTWNLCGQNAEAQLNVYIIAGDRDDESALLTLAPHLDDVLELFEVNQLPIVGPIEPDQVRATDTDTALPAFRITTTLTV